MTDEERWHALERSLTNITPGPDAIVRIERLRAVSKAFGLSIIQEARDSRERSLALTHLEEAVMWAVKAIVMEQPK
jgi:hypothetical protein